MAYEPIWAIGSGKTPTKAETETVASYVQKLIEKLSKQEQKAEDVKVLYGGSVKASNVKNFISASSISGVLVGGACLNAQEFFNLVKNCD